MTCIIPYDKHRNLNLSVHCATSIKNKNLAFLFPVFDRIFGKTQRLTVDPTPAGARFIFAEIWVYHLNYDLLNLKVLLNCII